MARFLAVIGLTALSRVSVASQESPHVCSGMADCSDEDAQLTLLQINAKAEVSSKRQKHEFTCAPQVVVNAGLPRTGTTSWVEWMESLGFKGMHFTTFFSALGVSKEETYENDFSVVFHTIDPEHGYAFADSPWPMWACRMAEVQPAELAGKVKYIVMEREPESWYNSLAAMNCFYGPFRSEEDATNLCDNTLPNQMEAFHYASPFVPWLYEQWCSSAKELGGQAAVCEDRTGDGKLSKAALHESKMMKKFMANHTHNLKECVPEEDLLVVSLEDEHKDKKMAKFLGCTGDIPSFDKAEDHALLQK